MNRYVYDSRGIKLLRVEEADPVCGEDWCDACGECLHCYGSDWCNAREEEGHLWVVYEDGEACRSNA